MPLIHHHCNLKLDGRVYYSPLVTNQAEEASCVANGHVVAVDRRDGVLFRNSSDRFHASAELTVYSNRDAVPHGSMLRGEGSLLKIFLVLQRDFLATYNILA